MEQTKRNLELESKLVVRQEKDRIAQDLHDSLGGHLSSISIGIRRIVKSSEDEAARSIQELADNALTELRNSLWVMDNESLSFSSLEERVNGLYWQYRKVGVLINLNVSLSETLTHINMPPETMGHLYRIIQEATNNSVKHSNATNFRTSIEKEDESIIVTLEDDGNGFDHHDLNDTGHYGLTNMQLRAKKIGASFLAESLPGKGAKIVIGLPFSSAVSL